MNPFSGVKAILKEKEEIEYRKYNIRQLIHENEELKKELSEMYRENRRYLTNGITR